jgi:hypothetical protein
MGGNWSAWKEILTSENTIIKSGSVNWRSNCWNVVGTKNNVSFEVKYSVFFDDMNSVYVDGRTINWVDDEINKKPFVDSEYKLLPGVTIKGYRGYGFVVFETPFPKGSIPSVSLSLTTGIGTRCAAEVINVTNKGFSFSIDRESTVIANHTLYWVATNKESQTQYSSVDYSLEEIKKIKEI